MEPTQTHSKTKYIVWGILILIIAGGTVFGATFFWKPQSLQTLKEIAVTASRPADVQTYTNAEYGFEIQLPKDWVIAKEDKMNHFIVFASEEKVKNVQKIREACNTNPDSAYCIENQPDLVFSSYAYGSTSIDKINKPIKTESINGKVFHIGASDDTHHSMGYEFYGADRSYNFYTFGATSFNNLRTILSTFKLTK